MVAVTCNQLLYSTENAEIGSLHVYRKQARSQLGRYELRSQDH